MISLLKFFSNKVLIVIFCVGFSQSVLAQKLKTKHIVEIKNMKFIPSELTVHKGDTIVWVNRDIFPHDVTEFKNKNWSSSTLVKGKSWQKIVAKSEDYYCSLHIVMKGRIIVN